MNLHTLDARYNEKITDAGIMHMKLHTLDTSYNSKITDAGIVHMNLHKLESYGSSITKDGYKHMICAKNTR